ncbi:MAG: NYN domain-containing protein [Patescibacteria group bacterium]
MRIHIYIDAANIILSARDSGLDFDFIRLITYLKEKYKSHKVFYFTARFYEHEEIYMQLIKLDVEIVFKESFREKNKLKANCDVEIAHRITYDIENNLVSSIVLASGDGDFVSLLDYAKKKIESVICFSSHPRHTSNMIKMRSYLKISYMSDILPLIQKREIPDTDLPV